jgi:hypothetical protein
MYPPLWNFGTGVRIHRWWNWCSHLPLVEFVLAFVAGGIGRRSTHSKSGSSTHPSRLRSPNSPRNPRSHCGRRKSANAKFTGCCRTGMNQDRRTCRSTLPVCRPIVFAVTDAVAAIFHVDAKVIAAFKTFRLAVFPV